MSSLPLTAREKKVVVAAAVAACLVGAFAGYGAYLGEEEAQFHGGVLEENRAEADWALIREPLQAFACWAAGTALITGIVPLAMFVRRRSSRKDAQ